MWNLNELNSIACNICGGTETRPVVRRDDGLLVVECAHCSLVYVNPRPRNEDIFALYNLGYYSSANEQKGHRIGYSKYLDTAQAQVNMHTARARLGKLSEFVNIKGKKILEVGCATGDLCALAQRRGAKVTGHDISEEVIALAKRRYPKVSFIAGDLQNAFRQGPYDIVVAFELIEHLTDPCSFFLESKKALEPGGLLVVSTPNYGCTRYIGAQNWLGFHHCFEHLYFFSPDSLKRMCDVVGLAPLASYTYGGSGVIDSYEQPQSRVILRSLSANLGILPVIRSLRFRLGMTTPQYKACDQGHALLYLMQKRGRQ